VEPEKESPQPAPGFRARLELGARQVEAYFYGSRDLSEEEAYDQDIICRKKSMPVAQQVRYSSETIRCIDAEVNMFSSTT